MKRYWPDIEGCRRDIRLQDVWVLHLWDGKIVNYTGPEHKWHNCGMWDSGPIELRLSCDGHAFMPLCPDCARKVIW